MVLAHAGAQIRATPAFVAGYLLTWAAVGVLGRALVEGVRSLDLGVLAWDEAGPYVAGGAILAAAIYQLSPLKKRQPAPLRTRRDERRLDGPRRRADRRGEAPAVEGSGDTRVVVLLAVLAVAVAFAPEDVPGLTIPGSPAAREAMERMGHESMDPARPMRMEDRTGARP